MELGRTQGATDVISSITEVENPTNTKPSFFPVCYKNSSGTSFDREYPEGNSGV